MRREQLEAMAEQIAAEIYRLEHMLSTHEIRAKIDDLYVELESLEDYLIYSPPRHKRR